MYRGKSTDRRRSWQACPRALWVHRSAAPDGNGGSDRLPPPPVFWEIWRQEDSEEEVSIGKPAVPEAKPATHTSIARSKRPIGLPRPCRASGDCWLPRSHSRGHWPATERRPEYKAGSSRGVGLDRPSWRCAVRSETWRDGRRCLIGQSRRSLECPCDCDPRHLLSFTSRRVSRAAAGAWYDHRQGLGHSGQRASGGGLTKGK